MRVRVNSCHSCLKNVCLRQFWISFCFFPHGVTESRVFILCSLNSAEFSEVACAPWRPRREDPLTPIPSLPLWWREGWLMQEIFRMAFLPIEGEGWGEGLFSVPSWEHLRPSCACYNSEERFSALRGSVGGLKTAGYEQQKQFILNSLSRTGVIMFRMAFLPCGRMRALKRGWMSLCPEMRGEQFSVRRGARVRRGPKKDTVSARYRI